MLELETLRSVKTELLKMLKMAYRERDQAREQLQSLVKKLIHPTTSNACFEIQHDNLVMLQPILSTKANSSITESNSPSHVSSPVDSFFETVSSPPEFSNMNVVNVAAVTVDSNSLGYLKQNLVQDFNNNVLPSEKPKSSDLASAVIDCLAKSKVLPQKGKLLEAVMDAGPLLHTLLLAGPLPTWRNPPPLSSIKIPPLSAKDFDAPATPGIGIHLNSFPNTLNSFQKSAAAAAATLPSSHSSEPTPMLNLVAGVSVNNTNNTWQLTSSSNSSLKRQRHQ